MHNFLKNQKGRLPFKMVVLGLAVILVLVGVIGGIGEIRETREMRNKTDVFDIRIPLKYTQPLVIASFNNFLSIQPVKANSPKMIKTGENTIKYIEAYQNTDVEQIRYPNKLKESLILKKAGHPERFEYELNFDAYDWQWQGKDLVFYQKGKARNELYKLFTIPEPYIMEHKNTENTESLNQPISEPVVEIVEEPLTAETPESASTAEAPAIQVEVIE